MAFCPNVNSKEYKDLAAVQGSAIAHKLWDKFRGTVPGFYYGNKLKGSAADTLLSSDQKKAWLTSRGIEANLFDTVEKIGSEDVHGYVENAVVHMWTNSDIGTEFHEAYHLSFRTMLSESQREQLYAEAAARFGEPTAGEIRYIKRTFPEISDEEAREAALEEKMADEFKDYVLTEGYTEKSLPAKIGKFFRDLWNFFKALVTNNLSLRQAYSLIESGKMNSSILGRGVFRNPEKFKGPKKAYMYRPEMGDAMFKASLDTIYTIFMDTKKDLGRGFSAKEQLGVDGKNGAIVDQFQMQMYKKTDGSVITVAEANKLFAAEIAMDAATPESLDDVEANMWNVLEEVGAEFTMEENITLRNVFKNVASTWNDVFDPATGNSIQTGWRTFLEIKLREAGIKITNKIVADTVTGEEVTEEEKDDSFDIDANNELDPADLDALQEEMKLIDEGTMKIYSMTTLQESPSKRLTGKVKELLSTIRNVEHNLLGVRSYMNREDVYQEMLRVFTGKQTFESMHAAIKKAAELKPVLQPIADFMSKLDDRDCAMLYTAFALVNTEFIMIKDRIEGNRRFADVINPNRKDVVAGTIDRWKTQLIRDNNENPRALYQRKPVLDTAGKPTVNTDGSPVTYLEADKTKILAAAAIVKDLEKGLNKADPRTFIVQTSDGSINETVEKVAELMWALGMHIGTDSSNIAETKWALQSLINVGVGVKSPNGLIRTYEGTGLLKLLAADLTKVLKLSAKFTPSRQSTVEQLETITPTADYISLNKALITGIVNYFTPMLNTIGESFVNSKGKAMYPSNLASNMNDIVNTLADGSPESVALYKEYMSDPFINGGNNLKFASVLFRYLKTPGYLKEFKVVDFDAAKSGDKVDDAMSYEDFSKLDNLVVRINAFINNDPRSETCFIAVPVQSDRNKYSFIEVPRVLVNPYGIDNSEADLIKAQIVQDLLRVSAAKQVVHTAITTKNYSTLLEGVHTEPGNPTKKGILKDNKYLGNAFSEDFFQFTAKDADGVTIVTDEVIKDDSVAYNGVQQLSDKIDAYVKGTLTPAETIDIDARLAKMALKMSDYFTKQADSATVALKDGGKIGSLGVGAINFSQEKGALETTMRGFIVTEALMRNEIVKVFRGSRANHKNLENFYKRMGHLTTPGTRLALQGELSNARTFIKGELYGMIKEFNEVTMRDLHLDLTPALTAQGHVACDNIARGLINNELSKLDSTVSKYKVTFEYDATAIEKAPAVKISGKNITINAANSKGRVSSEKINAEIAVLLPTAARAFEKSLAIADAYRPGAFESTDAQAFISLDMHRYISMGEGKWGTEEEEAYKAYKTTGKFVYQKGFLPKGYKEGEAVPVTPHKPYYEDVHYDRENNMMSTTSEKNSYTVLLKEYTKDFPHLEDIRSRMELDGQYAGQGLQPLHVLNHVSGKKIAKRGVYQHTGNIGELSNMILNKNNSKKLRFPQNIGEMKPDPKVIISRQLKKNMIANVADGTIYDLNAGLGSQVSLTGSAMKKLYHAAIEEKLRRDTNAVEEELGIDKLREATELGDVDNLKKVKLEVLQKVRDILLKQIDESDLPSNYSDAIKISFDETGMPRFSIPLDLPIYNKKYESIIMSLVNNKVFNQKAKGYDAVQIAQIGGHRVDNALNFTQISEDGKRVIHAEIMIREDIARQFGIEPGESLDDVPEELRRIIGYRTPNADKSATIILKIAKFLPANYQKGIVVPGQLIKLMGSDHDVDKLTLLFPEVEKVEPTPEYPYSIRKVIPNYKTLAKNVAALSNEKLVTPEMLNNIIFDTVEAVYSNPAHFNEVFAPLDDTTLTNEAKRIRKVKPELGMATDWNAWDTESNTIIRSIKGNKLRGIYANMLSGRNVASHGNIAINKSHAIKIIDDSGKVTEYINYVKEAQGIPTDRSTSLFLSAAVDASNVPIHTELNDNMLTSRVRALFLGFFPEYNSKTCTNFLNQPIIRELITVFETKHGGDLRKLTKSIDFIKTKYNLNKLIPKGEGINLAQSLPMKASELANISGSKADTQQAGFNFIEGRDMAEQAIFLHNFEFFSKAGRSLMNMYKRITPDSMDGMNRIGSIQGYQDKQAEFDEDYDTEDGKVNKEVLFFDSMSPGRNVVDQYIGENSIYGFERGYEKLLRDGLELAGMYFPIRTSNAFNNFKENLKRASGRNDINAEMHQLIDYNLMFMMLMKPGSPFFANTTYGDLYSSPTNNIGERMLKLRAKHPALASAPFIANLELDVNAQAGYYGLKFDNSVTPTRSSKEAYTNNIRTMLYNPIAYVSAPLEQKFLGPDGKYSPEIQSQVNQIKRLGRDLVMHTFITNGFRQSADSYSDLVPAEFFTTPMEVEGSDKKVTISEFMYNEREKLADGNYFNAEDLVKYMTMFGKMRAAGQGMLSTINSEELKPDMATVITSNDTHKPFVIVRNQDAKTSAVYQRIPNDSREVSMYTALAGSFAARGATKLYGTGISYVLKNDVPTNLVSYLTSGRSAVWEDGVNNIGNEDGTMSCFI